MHFAPRSQWGAAPQMVKNEWYETRARSEWNRGMYIHIQINGVQWKLEDAMLAGLHRNIIALFCYPEHSIALSFCRTHTGRMWGSPGSHTLMLLTVDCRFTHQHLLGHEPVLHGTHIRFADLRQRESSSNSREATVLWSMHPCTASRVRSPLWFAQQPILHSPQSRYTLSCLVRFESLETTGGAWRLTGCILPVSDILIVNYLVEGI